MVEDNVAADDLLAAAREGSSRAKADSRWFAWVAVVVGVVMIPNGFVVPWDLPARLIVMGATFVGLIAVALVIRPQKVVPRGSSLGLATCVGVWTGLSMFISALAGNVETIGDGLFCSSLASLPYGLLALYYAGGLGAKNEASA